MAAFEELTDVSVVDLGGNVVAVMNVLSSDTCRDIKMRVADASEWFAEQHMLMWNGKALSDHLLVSEIGFTLGGSVEIRVIRETGEAFLWADVAPLHGSVIRNAEQKWSMYTRETHPNMTNGVRGLEPLPLVAEWYIYFEGIGSHACVGVATEDSELTSLGYNYLFGDDTTSWSLCFGSGRISFMHGSEVKDVDAAPTSSGPDATMKVLMRRDNKVLFATLADDGNERLLFDDIPMDVPLFAVASTVWGNGRIGISREELQHTLGELASKRSLFENLQLQHSPCPIG
eukprot:TRINITY_DN20121_c0_g1_i1.p1 TRINITY_DN20121_c0_g1~~TRINITY_DN20121_c0_g1_i1.p1  ORF type:complete len:287 (-),score=23.83 TRINITY_DN20121_c0_g1_i1:121-981(-)